MVREILQTQMEAAELGVMAQDVAKCLKLFGLAIRSHAHHFVFVAESRKAQILCDCRVIQAERMGEGDCAINLHAVAHPEAPHGAGKSPRPSAESKNACSKGETKNALAK